MAKAERPKKTAKPSKKDQYERFQQTARDLGIDDKEGTEAFEQAFKKIVPPRNHPRRQTGTKTRTDRADP
jgi:hypothetical protein